MALDTRAIVALIATKTYNSPRSRQTSREDLYRAKREKERERERVARVFHWTGPVFPAFRKSFLAGSAEVTDRTRLSLFLIAPDSAAAVK